MPRKRVYGRGADAFWAKIDVRGDDECWPCLLKPIWNGYCTTRYGDNPKKRTAHAIAYEIATGDKFGPGEVACHRCDNRVCCNPSHIFKGTYSENTRDMFSKGRANREGSSRKLSLEQAESIRAEYATGEVKQVDLAKKYGIAAQNISLLLQGKTYTGKRRGPTSDESNRKRSESLRATWAARKSAA